MGRSNYNAETAREYTRNMRLRLRVEVLAAYGGKCVCCGESNPSFLTVDHINNDGAAHRREINGVLYPWLKRNGFPQDRFQLLCANCNFGKQWNGGVCPHVAPPPPPAPAKGWPTPDAEVLRELYVVRKMTLENIGKQLGIGARRVGRFVKEFGLTRAPLPTGRLAPLDVDRMRELISNPSIKWGDIERELGLTRGTLRLRAKELGIVRPRIWERKLGEIDEKRLREAWDSGLDWPGVERALGLSRKAILRRAKRLGLELDRKSRADKGRKRKRREGGRAPAVDESRVTVDAPPVPMIEGERPPSVRGSF